MRAALAAVDDAPERDYKERMRALRRVLRQLEARQARLIHSLERDDDPEGVIFRRVRDRLTELEHERTSKMKQLQKLEAERFVRTPGNPALLDALPVGDVNLLDGSDELVRQLLEALRLEIRYD